MNQHQDFPIDLLPPIFRAAVTTVEALTSAPYSLISASAIGAASVFCQSRIMVRRPDMNPSPVSLFLMTIAESGERKSAVDQYFFEPLLEKDRVKRQEYRDKLASYEQDLHLWQALNRSLGRKLDKCVNTGKGIEEAQAEVSMHALRRPKKPHHQRTLYSDVSPQALIEQMHQGSQHAALQSNEAGSLLTGNALSDLPLLNQAWDGQPLQVDRLDRSAMVEQPMLTLSLMVQPGGFDNFIQRSGDAAKDNGFFSRLLLCKVVPRAGFRQVRDLSQVSRAGLESLRRRMHLGFVVMPDDRVLSFDREAERAWRNFVQETEYGLAPNGRWSLTKGFAAKAAEHVARLAAIFEHLETKKSSISLDSVECAIGIVRWYMHQHDDLLGTGIERRDLDKKAQVLRAWIENWKIEHPGEFCIETRQICRIGPGSIRTAEVLRKVVAIMPGFSIAREIRSTYQRPARPRVFLCFPEFAPMQAASHGGGTACYAVHGHTFPQNNHLR